jgi:CRP-like cAMP-binding protein
MSVERRLLTSNTLIEALNIPKDSRRPEDLDQILKYTSTFKFFYEIIERQGSNDMALELCKDIILKTYSPQETIFKTGDTCDYIYFIIKGSVKVFSNSYIDIDEPGDEEIHRLIRKALEGSFNKSKKKDLREIEVTRLSLGDSFGEMALINDRNRYYTVESIDYCILAGLHKDDYLRIEGTQEKQVNEKMDFLRSLEVFKSWSKISLYKLSFYFKETKFKRGAPIYNQGDTPNAVYIIKEGDFRLTQKFSINAGNKSSAETSYSKGSAALKSVKPNTIRYKDLQVVTKQPGEIFGFEEIIDKLPYRQFTCKCISQTGKIIWISEKNYTKKITHPESIKIIEEQYKIFKLWVTLRLKELKETELYKDDNSFTPYQRLKITPRPATNMLATPTRNFSTINTNENSVLPLILKKILTSRKSSSHQKHKKLISGNFSMFATELDSQLSPVKISEKYLNINYNALKSAPFTPVRLSKPKLKKFSKIQNY